MTETPRDNGQPTDAAEAATAAQRAMGLPPSNKPPRGPKLWIIVAVLAAFAATLWLGAATGGEIARGWHHLWRAVRGEVSPAVAATSTGQYYTCGMHPWVILPKPGDCPICGMKLVPLDPAKFTGAVTINPVVAQDIGIRVSPVLSGPVERTIRTVGTVTYDETRVRDVNTKIGGWIEKLHVDSLGAPVKQGEPLFELYSPELYAAQEEYLLAWENRNKVGADFVPDAAQGAKDLLSSARTKLEYFDITPRQIQALQDRGTPAKTMTIQSPHDGVVIAKQATEGMKVEPGMQVYRIADLSKVWVMVTLYEYQLPYVQLGQSATMSLSYLPGQQFQGRVIYIYPYMSDKTRQVDVRLEFENSTGLLKPGMYATIDLHSTLANDRTLAPRSAVIDTGERKVAFVSLGQGRFEPRNVQTGAEAKDGMLEILSGLKPGEKVVTSGQFLIDSEANVRDALAKMIKGNLAVDQQPSVASAGSTQLKALPEAAAQSLQAILSDYLAIQNLLAADSTQAIADPAGNLAARLNELLKVNLAEDPHFWQKHEEVATARGKALALVQVETLEGARLAFADLSVALDSLLKATGVPRGFAGEVQELHCPMYRQGQGGTIWLQAAGEVRNPYYGSAMPGCFDQRKALPIAGQPRPDAPDSRPGQGASTIAPAAGPAPATAGASVTADEQKQIDALIRAYLRAHDLLAQDQMQGVPALLKNIHDAAGSLAASSSAAIAAAARQAIEASNAAPRNLEEARLAYKPLSLALIDLVKLAPPGAGVAATLYQIHCPMTKGDWLQTTDKIANPYYGQAMLTCGEVVGKLGGGQAR